MVEFPLKNAIFRIADEATPGSKASNEEWFAEDITIVLSADDRGAPIVIDFSYSLPSLVEYTLDSGNTWVAFNNGNDVVGGQSRYIRVTNGNQLNFRAFVAGTLNRAIVGDP